jgi:hypothetical protein
MTGEGGLATAFGLMRERVANTLVVDENPEDRDEHFASLRSFAEQEC